MSKDESTALAPIEHGICQEILQIMEVYHEQDKRCSVDTPGGLEHMGDVWALLGKWERRLKGVAQ